MAGLSSLLKTVWGLRENGKRRDYCGNTFRGDDVTRQLCERISVTSSFCTRRVPFACDLADIALLTNENAAYRRQKSSPRGHAVKLKFPRTSQQASRRLALSIDIQYMAVWRRQPGELTGQSWCDRPVINGKYW